jgi:hypothetical protein
VSQGKGTPPSKSTLESLARGYTVKSIERLGGYATGEGVDAAIQLRAIELILDRGYGRPKQQKELSGPDGEPINLVIRNLVEELREKNKQT